MNYYLRQSTASQTIMLGPFMDDGDGKTPKTSLTIANTDVKLYRLTSGTESNKNSGGATHVAAGRYSAIFDATDTATLGSGEINSHVTGALPVKTYFCVLPANIYDSMIAGSDLFDVSMTQIAGSAVNTAAAQLGVNVVSMAANTVNASALATDAVTEIQTGLATASALSTVDSNVTTVAGYVDTEVAAIKAKTDNLPSDPASASTLAGLIGGLPTPLTAAGMRTAVGLATANLDTQIGTLATSSALSSVASTTTTIAGYVDTEVAAIKAKTDYLPSVAAGAAGGLPTVDANNRIVGIQGTITTLDALDTEQDTQHTATQGRLPAALVSGRMDSSVGAMAADTMTAAAAAADLGTEIGTAVWANATRVLSAGTNIVLAKGTGVTGFTDISTSQVNTEVAAALETYDGPTNAEMIARTVTSATYATASALSTVSGYVDTEVASIKAVTDKLDTTFTADGANYKFTGASLVETPTGAAGLDAAGVRSAIGLVSANLDTQLGTLATASALSTVAGYVDTEVAAIKAKTDNLPVDPADASVIAGLIGALPAPLDAAGTRTALGMATANMDTQLVTLATASALSTVAGYVDTEVAAIKAKTDLLPSVAAGTTGGLPTVDANNRIVGIQGTITTLDALDTAQDTQHANTYTRLGAPTGVSVSADVAAIKAQTVAIEADTTVIGATGAGLTSLASAANLSTVASNVTDILADTAVIGATGAGLTSLATASALATVAGYVDTEVASIKAVIDRLDTTIEVDGSNYKFTSAALIAAPVGAAGLDAAGVRSALGMSTANLDTKLNTLATASVLATVAGYVDTEVSAIKIVTDKLDTTFTADGANYKYTSAALIETPAGSGGGLDAAGVRSAIGLATANMDTQLGTLSTASALSTVAGYVDTEVAAIKVVVDKLDTTLEAGAGATFKFTTPALAQGPVGAASLDAAGVRSALGMATANLDTQIGTLSTASALATVAGYVDTEVAAIKAKTDNLPSVVAGGNGGLPTVDANNRIVGIQGTITTLDALDTQQDTQHSSTYNRIGAPVGASLSADVAAVKSQTVAIEADTSVIGSTGQGLTSLASAANLTTLTGYVDTEVAAIKAKTDNLPSDPADHSLVIAATDAIATLLGTPAGISVSADVAAIKSQTAAIEADTTVIGATGAGLTSLASASNLSAVSGNVDAILADTEIIGATGAGLTSLASAANLSTVNNSVNSIKTDTGTTIPGLINTVNDTANSIKTDTGTTLSGLITTVDNVVDAIQAKTDNLPSDPADASVIAAAFTAIPAAVWAQVIEGTITAAGFQRLVLAAVAGKTTDSGLKFRNIGDTKDRIVGTVLGSDRTSITYDAT